MSKPIVVIACMLSSSESWEPQTAPTSLALTCRWRSRPQHQKQTSRDLANWAQSRATYAINQVHRGARFLIVPPCHVPVGTHQHERAGVKFGCLHIVDVEHR